MTINRMSPIAGPMSGTEFASKVNEEVAALWRIAAEPLTSIGGTANAITANTLITVSGGYTAYEIGNKFHFTAATGNTAAATINIRSLGAKSIKTAAGNDLSAGQLVAGTEYIIIYDGTDFRLVQAVIDLGAEIAGAASATSLGDDDEFVVSLATDSTARRITKSNLAATLAGGMTLVSEQEPTSDVSEVTQDGLYTYRDVAIAWVVHLNNTSANVLISGRVSGGTWRDILTVGHSNSKSIGFARIQNFGRDNNIKIGFLHRSNPSGNVDRTSEVANGTGATIVGYSTFDEQWDEIKLSVSASTIEGDNADRRAWIGVYGESPGQPLAT